MSAAMQDPTTFVAKCREELARLGPREYRLRYAGHCDDHRRHPNVRIREAVLEDYELEQEKKQARRDSLYIRLTALSAVGIFVIELLRAL